MFIDLVYIVYNIEAPSANFKSTVDAKCLINELKRKIKDQGAWSTCN